MIPPIPILGDYAISPEYGFLPAELPLERLPDPYYNKWEAIVVNLQSLILTRRLRGVVDRLPILSTAGLEHDLEWKRAYSLLCFMAHGYIWGGDSPSEVHTCHFFLYAAWFHMLTPLAASAGLNFDPIAPYLRLPRSSSSGDIRCRLLVEFQAFVCRRACR